MPSFCLSNLITYVNRYSVPFLFIGPLIVLLFFLCFLALLLRRSKQSFAIRERIMLEEGLSIELAGRLVNLVRTKNRLFKNNYSFTSRKRSKNLEELLQFEFYVYARVIRQLESLKEHPEPDVMFKKLDQVMNEISQHLYHFKLADQAQQEIWSLCQQSERRLRKYDKIVC
ncbi:hypothetical protein M3Y97_00613900 [Aphelenchoides bicaudatus]|nr:hypothetical protein M3Y97_00613900 [Aphelenchoides bicaudatus]